MNKLELSKQFKDYPDVLNVDQASSLLGVSTKQVYKLLGEQKIPSVRIGRSHRIAKINLINFIRFGEKKSYAQNVSKFVWTVPNPCGMLVSENSKKSAGCRRKGMKAI